MLNNASYKTLVGGCDRHRADDYLFKVDIEVTRRSRQGIKEDRVPQRGDVFSVPESKSLIGIAALQQGVRPPRTIGVIHDAGGVGG